MVELLKATLTKVCEPTEQIRNELAAQETVLRCFQAGRDYLVFTDKRLFFLEKQGITGAKTTVTSWSWRPFYTWKTANELTAAEAVLTSESGTITFYLNAACDIPSFKRLLAEVIS